MDLMAPLFVEIYSYIVIVKSRKLEVLGSRGFISKYQKFEL